MRIVGIDKQRFALGQCDGTSGAGFPSVSIEWAEPARHAGRRKQRVHGLRPMRRSTLRRNEARHFQHIERHTGRLERLAEMESRSRQGQSHFYEVYFTTVPIPDSQRLGAVVQG
jgi:hypothetical protein